MQCPVALEHIEPDKQDHVRRGLRSYGPITIRAPDQTCRGVGGQVETHNHATRPLLSQELGGLQVSVAAEQM